MTDKEVELLIFALQMGWKAITGFYYVSVYCEDLRNDYFMMIQNLAQKVGVNLDAGTD